MQQEQLPEPNGRPGTGTVVVSIAALTSPGLGFVVPFLGPWLSMLAVGVAVRRGRRRVWRGPRRPWLSPAVIAALWGPGLLALLFLVNFGERLGSPDTGEALQRVAFLIDTAAMTYWLFLPLAAPADIVTPGVVACAVLAAGAAGSTFVRQPWPWLVAAGAAPLTYAGVVLILDIPFVA